MKKIAIALTLVFFFAALANAQDYNTGIGLRGGYYYGLGAHVGFWEGAHLNSGVLGTNYTIIGIDGILGIEYNIREAPLNISLDWKPAFNIIGYSEFWPLGGAFSIRYIF